jgi:Ribonuclease G/E
VVDFLRKNKKERIEAIEEEFGRGIVISVDPNAGPEDYEIKRFDK